MKFFINNKKIQRDRVGKNFDSRGKQPKSFTKKHPKPTAVLSSWLEETSNCTVKLVRFSPRWNWIDGKLPKSFHLFDFASSKYTLGNLFFCSFCSALQLASQYGTFQDFTIVLLQHYECEKEMETRISRQWTSLDDLYLSLVNSRTLIYIIFIVLKSLFNVCILGSPSEVNELEVWH